MIGSYLDDKDAVCEVTSGLLTLFSADTPDVERLAHVHAYQCSYVRASAHVGRPNLLTWEGIYQQALEPCLGSRYPR